MMFCNNLRGWTMAALLLSAIAHAQAPEITIELSGGVPLEMVWIEPGTFLMGSPASERERWGAGATGFEIPQHPVTISRGFYLGKYELTQEQWTAVTGTNPWIGVTPGFGGRECPRCPAGERNWREINDFIHRLNEYPSNLSFRLPTEAEWEYAGKAGTNTTWPFGDNEEELDAYAWYGANSGCSGDFSECGYREVGLKKPNPWGLYDMYGNVYEWVEDVAYRRYTGEAQTDPLQTEPLDGWDRLQVLKGGGYSYPNYLARPAARSADEADPDFGRIRNAGIRLLGYPNKSTLIPHTPWGLVKQNQIDGSK